MRKEDIAIRLLTNVLGVNRASTALKVLELNVPSFITVMVIRPGVQCAPLGLIVLQELNKIVARVTSALEAILQ